jgi:DNA primase
MEKGMVSADLQRRLRNDLPMSVTISALGREGPPSKMRDGRFCFLCPHCDEMLAYVNPRNNLAHCFGCGKNLNNIDLLLSLDYNFADAVALLELWLHLHQTQRSKHKRTEAK